MARSVVLRRQPRQSLMPQPVAGNSSNDGDPWYHDPDYTGNTVNLLRETNDEAPGSNYTDENGRWRRYIAAVEDAWAECYHAAEDQAATIEELTAEVESLRMAGGGDDEADRATREALAARAVADAAQQESAALRTQVAAAEEAVRMVMASNARSQGGGGNAANVNTFTIESKRLPVFKGERDIQVVGDIISDLQRQFEPRCHEIGWLEMRTPAGSGTTTPTMAATEATTPKTEGWTRYALLQLKEAAGRWATSTFEEFTPLDALRNFEDDWRQLTIPAKGHVATFNKEFRRLRLQLDPHAPMTAPQLLDKYAAKLRPNEMAYHSFIQYRNFRREMGGVPTLERAMVFVAYSDTSAPPKDKAKAAEISAMYGQNVNRNRGNRPPLAPNECAKCHATDGHWAYDCPNQEAPVGNNGGRGGHGGSGNRGGRNGGADRGGRGRHQREVNAAEAVESQETGSQGGQQAENA
ncbi:hypothetical protein K440DRAFT_642106 [Wilcoxina mikolae CBS 423.85]|nr:hypothetical protein K440DRAFT_642106 [Wilcoxina mikolae CBS 423.85]